jgi:hypothetical protein
MLNDYDIEFMRQSRSEIIANRTSKIIVKYKDVTERDPFTGEPIGELEVQRTVQSVVTEISSIAKSGADRWLESGIKLESGDLWLSVNIDDVGDILDKIERIEYDGKRYEILAKDKKGIGAVNRVEIVARLIS